MTNTRTAGIGTIIACIIGAVVFGLIGMSDQKFVKNCLTTPGQITEVVKKVTTERDRTGTSSTRRTRKKTSYQVSFSYTVDGKDYTERDKINHSVEVGPTTVYYLPDSPDNAKLSKPSPTVDFVVAVALLIGAGFIGFKTLFGGATAG